MPIFIFDQKKKKNTNPFFIILIFGLRKKNKNHTLLKKVASIIIMAVSIIKEPKVKSNLPCNFHLYKLYSSSVLRMQVKDNAALRYILRGQECKVFVLVYKNVDLVTPHRAPF